MQDQAPLQRAVGWRTLAAVRTSCWEGLFLETQRYLDDQYSTSHLQESLGKPYFSTLYNFIYPLFIQPATMAELQNSRCKSDEAPPSRVTFSDKELWDLLEFGSLKSPKGSYLKAQSSTCVSWGGGRTFGREDPVRVFGY